jgi:hypothetical protein
VAGFAWIAGLVAAGVPAGAQQATGTVTGTVVDAATNAAIPDALIHIVGLPRVARTGPDGHYRLTGVPVGPQTVQLNRLGYVSATKAAAVTDGGTVTADFAATQTAVTLDVQIIQGTAVAATAARAIGASVTTISPDSLLKAPMTNLSEVLNSRVAGLTIEQNSGVVGSGSRIYLRGVSSATLATEPLIVVDGVRAYNDVNGINDIGGVGGQGISRFDDLDF